MTSGSILEQLTSNGSFSLVTIGSSIAIAAVITYLIASRFFFSSSSKSKSSSSKQQSNKSKDGNTKKQQESNAKKKGNNTKAKKNTTAATSSQTVKVADSSASQSDESEEEQTPVVQQTKKPTPAANKAPQGKKAVIAEENVKGSTPNKETKSAGSINKQQQVAGRNENNETAQNATAGDNKKKPAKATAGAAPAANNKTQSKGKDEATNKSNANASNKKQQVVADVKVAVNDETEETPDQDDEGQWVTQSSKQVNNRNRNKGKIETSTGNQQETSPTSNRKNASEKRSTVVPSTETTMNNEVDTESSNNASKSVAPVNLTPEPIEICQLLPSKENPYTASDDWWKQGLPKKGAFSVDDIGEWPERDQDEQYVVNVKRIIPTKPLKSALTEKDINVDLDNREEFNGNVQRRQGKLDRDDEQKNSNDSTNGTSQSKKKATNVRRVS